MSSAASDVYKRQVIKLIILLRTYAESNGLGAAFCAPLDVEFDEQNIFQPDVFFIPKQTDELLKNEEVIRDTPSFVTEVLSKNKSYDLGEKMEVYGKFGVKEYWVIDTEKETLFIYENANGKMEQKAKFTKNEKAKSNAIQGFEIDLKNLFQ